MIIDSNAKEYKLTKPEKNRMLLQIAILLLFSLLGIIFSVLILYFSDPSAPVIIGVFVILLFSMLLLIYSQKYFLDIRNGKVCIYSGVVTHKQADGIENPVCYFNIDGKRHHVSPFIYCKVKEGVNVKIRKAEHSGKVLSVEILNKEYSKTNFYKKKNERENSRY